MASRARRAVVTLGCVLLSAAACGHAAPEAAPATADVARPPTRRFVSPHAYEHFLLAELAFARGAWAEAIDRYREALADEDEPFVLARLAEALERAGDREAAEEAIALALSVDPRSEAAWLARGTIAERQGDLDRALDAYTRAADAAPASAQPALALHRVLAARGQHERARAALVRYRERDEDGVASETSSRVALELALVEGDAGSLAQAVDDWLRFGRLDARTAHRAARALLAKGRTAAALRLLEGVPDDGGDPAVLLEALLAAARFDAADVLLDRTPADALGGPVALAEAYLRCDDPDAALEALAEADDPHARVVRAEAELSLGRHALAARHFAAVPPASAHAQRARTGLAKVLRAQGLDALAAEVAARARQ